MALCLRNARLTQKCEEYYSNLSVPTCLYLFKYANSEYYSLYHQGVQSKSMGASRVRQNIPVVSNRFFCRCTACISLTYRPDSNTIQLLYIHTLYITSQSFISQNNIFSQYVLVCLSCHQRFTISFGLFTSLYTYLQLACECFYFQSC